MSGEIIGTVDAQGGGNFRTEFNEIRFDVREGADSSNIQAQGAAVLAQQGQNQECQILYLDIGPIFLDLLGLQVDLSEIVLDITAVGGQGNLLGNLLCAVANS